MPGRAFTPESYFGSERGRLTLPKLSAKWRQRQPRVSLLCDKLSLNIFWKKLITEQTSFESAGDKWWPG